MHPDRVLVKTSTDNSRWQTERCSDEQVPTIVAGRRRDAQTIKILEAHTFIR